MSRLQAELTGVFVPASLLVAGTIKGMAGCQLRMDWPASIQLCTGLLLVALRFSPDKTISNHTSRRRWREIRGVNGRHD